MAKKRVAKSPSPPAAGPVTYEMEFVGEPDPIDGLRIAKLTSTLLDPVMHRGHAVAVPFEASEHTVAGRVVIDDPFKADSLVAYLTTQASVRRALEAELARERELNDTEKKFARGAIWKHARVTTLVLRRRHIPTRESLQRVKKLTEYQLDFLMAQSDTPTTRSKFQVIIDVPWDVEHKVCSAWFRDGALTSFGAGI